MKYILIFLLAVTISDTALAKNKKNGEQCKRKQECSSGHCFPYVDKKNYCIHDRYHCAMPNKIGVKWNKTTEFNNLTWVCKKAKGWVFSASTTAKKIASKYSCEKAKEIKFVEEKYTKLTSLEQTTVDGTYRQCQINKKAKASNKPADEIVVFTANPIPIDQNDKVFYGIVKRKDLENATKNCSAAGKKTGLIIAVAGATPVSKQAGGFLYEYSDVSCNGLKNAIEDDNLMTLIAPTNIIANSASDKYISDVISKIPLVSKADKKRIIKIYKKANDKLKPSIKIKKGKVHIDAGPIGGGIGINVPW